VFLVKKDKIFSLEKSDYYIQSIVLPQNLSTESDIFLMEDVVAEFCNSISKIREQDWWMYAAQHENGLRIIAGIGKGIILSRFLNGNSRIFDEISKTLIYLHRFGIIGNVKIFSPSGDVEIHTKIIVERNCIDNAGDMDKAIFNFLSINKQIAPIISNKNHLKQIFNEKILYITACVLVLIFCGIHKELEGVKNSILLLEKDVPITTEAMELKINDKNLFITRQFIDKIKKMQNPLQSLSNAAKICRLHHIDVEQFIYENQIKIKTSLSKSNFEKLKSCQDIVIKRISNEEYEELGASKKIGSIICIK
jgi:rRNA-processing protein FCF1